jgi:hypothetical protein
LAIVDSSNTNSPVSTKPGQLQKSLAAVTVQKLNLCSSNLLDVFCVGCDKPRNGIDELKLRSLTLRGLMTVNEEPTAGGEAAFKLTNEYAAGCSAKAVLEHRILAVVVLGCRPVCEMVHMRSPPDLP